MWFSPDPSAIERLLAEENAWQVARGSLSAWCIPYWWLGDPILASDRFVRSSLIPTFQRWGMRLCLDVGRGSWWHATLETAGRGDEFPDIERGWWERIGRLANDGLKVDVIRAAMPVSQAYSEATNRSIADIAKDAGASMAPARKLYPNASLGVVEATFSRGNDRWSYINDLQSFRGQIKSALGKEPDFMHMVLTTDPAGPSPREVGMAQIWMRANGISSGIVLGELNPPGRPRTTQGEIWHDRVMAALVEPYWATAFVGDAVIISSTGVNAPLLPETDLHGLTHLVNAVVNRFQEDPLPSVSLREAPSFAFPLVSGRSADSNSPSHWDGDTFYLFNSVNRPWRSSGPGLHALGSASQVDVPTIPGVADRWLEATHKDAGGTLYGWYHVEPYGICPPETNRPDVPLTAPRIGAMKSTDNGAHWQDLGIVIEAPGKLRCNTANRYYASGVGDFTVLLDPSGQYFYFLFSCFAEDVGQQGVAAARMAYDQRDTPVGKVFKWHRGDWSQPGLSGQSSMVFPALVDWHQKGGNGFWGPSIHWNTHLEQYVMLLNRAASSDWQQEGVYVSFSQDIANPDSWTAPRRIRGGGDWYAQVVGTDSVRRETDKVAGQIARYFEKGQSSFEIVFERPGAVARTLE
ncbi:MAG: hypothetical protein U0821_26880 [Chloroflexota bacterium]